MLLRETLVFKFSCFLVYFLMVYQTALPLQYLNNLNVTPSTSVQSYSDGFVEAIIDFFIPSADASDLLVSTPEFDLDDPFIIEKAAALGYDPQQIFSFVRDQVGFESYEGSLRGARGTLWSQAGNAMDQASLMIALLRASGVQAQYVAGTLNKANAQTLIASMFEPAPYRIVGFLSDGVEKSDPMNDWELINESRRHVWVEYDNGGVFVSADPSFKSAVLGQTFAGAESRFEEVPDERRHKIGIRLNVEQNRALLGPITTTVLEFSFTSSELVGKPISLGHYVDSDLQPSLFGTTATHIYTPYLIVNQNDGDINDDPLYRGQDYQEYFSAVLPYLASTPITGVFLQIDTVLPGGSVETEERALVDRIGYAGRNSGETVLDNTIDDPTISTINALDTYTILVETQPNAPQYYDSALVYVNELGAEANVILDSIDPNAIDSTLYNEWSKAYRQNLVAGTTATLFEFSKNSDEYIQILADVLVAKAYMSKPRIFATSFSHTSQSQSQLASMDLIKNQVRVVAYPMQAEEVIEIGQTLIGAFEGFIEHIVASESFASTNSTGETLDTITVIKKAIENGVEIITLQPYETHRVEYLLISAEAKLRVVEALAQGRIVTIPTASVEINGEKRVGWYETDLATGAIIDTFETGGHIVSAELSAYSYFFVGAGVITGLTLKDAFFQTGISVKGAIGILIALLATLMPPVGAALFSGFGAAALAGDPPLPPYLVGMTAFDSTNYSMTTVIDEPLYTLPFESAQLKSLQRLIIPNLSDSDITYSISIPNQPPGFVVTPSLSEMTVPAGETGLVGIMLSPETGIQPAGTEVNFGIVVTGDEGSVETLSHDWIVPETLGMSLEMGSAVFTTTPGVPVTTPLTITAYGNVPAVDVPLTVESTGGLVVAGVPSTISLATGESQSFEVTLTPDFLVANDQSSVTVTASYGEDLDGNPFKSSAKTILKVRFAEVLSTEKISQLITQLEDESLTAVFSELPYLITQILIDPQPDLIARFEKLLGDVAKKFSIDSILWPYVAELEAIQQALANGDDVATLVQQLDALMTSMESAVQERVDNYQLGKNHDFTVGLWINPVDLNGTADVTFRVRNNTPEPVTLDLSAVGLPMSFSASFHEPSVALAGWESQDLTLTLSQTGPTDLSAFNVTIEAFAQGTVVKQSASVAVSLRPEFVQIIEIFTTPSYLPSEATTRVDIDVKILNSINHRQTNRYRLQTSISDAEGVLRHSFDRAVWFEVGSGIETVTLYGVSIEGNPIGQYRVTSQLTDNGMAIGDPVVGYFYVGSPVTASISSTPAIALPGDSTIEADLSFGLQPLPGNQIQLLSQTSLGDNARSLALVDHLAYVCAEKSVKLVDVADDTAPSLVKTFGEAEMTTGFTSICRIIDGKLVVFSQQYINAPALRVLVFDISVPLDPVLTADTSTPLRFASDVVQVGNTGFISLNTLRFLGSALVDQLGDVVSLDFSDLSSPVILDRFLENRALPDSGNRQMRDLLLADETTLYVASTTATGSTTPAQEMGRISILDISNLSHLHEVSAIDLPDAVHVTGIAVGDGKLLAVSNTEDHHAFLFPFRLTGEVVFSLYDISNTRAPVLIATKQTTLNAEGNTSVHYLGGGFFSVGGMTKDGLNVLGIVDVNDVDELQVSTRLAPAALKENQVIVGNRIYAPSAAGLGIYDITAINATYDVLYSANVPVPNSAGVTHILENASTPPTRVEAQMDSTTLIWEGVLNLSNKGEILKWPVALADLGAGEMRDMVLPGYVDFIWPASTQRSDFPQGRTDRIALEALSIVGQHIIGIEAYPDARDTSFNAGETATYRVTVENPTDVMVTYDLSLQGVPQAWGSLGVVQLAPGATEHILVELNTTPADAPGDFVIVAAANMGGQRLDTAQAPLRLIKQTRVNLTQPAVHLQLITDVTPAGQGVSAEYLVRVTNIGERESTFKLSGTFPSGFSGEFEESFVTLLPGPTSARNVKLRVTPPVGANAGVYPMTIRAISEPWPDILDTTTGTIEVADLGVKVNMVNVSSSQFNMTVTNTGKAAETFDLSLGGPVAIYSELTLPEVTLAAGASAVVAINVGAITTALPGTLELVGMATARSNTTIRDFAVGVLTIDAISGVTAQFDPDVVEVSTGGLVSTVMYVENTGNLETAYRAAITATSGDINAALVGLTGEATQVIESFLLPPRFSGYIRVDSELTGSTGTVTVTVTSTTDSTVTASDTVTFLAVNQPPVANAGADSEGFVDDIIILNGSLSTDPDGDPLTYAWRFVSAPFESQTTLLNADQLMASFVADAKGIFILELTVNDGFTSSSDTVTITVPNRPPVAVAGEARNVSTLSFVELNGSDSLDLDHDQLTYHWTTQSSPLGSNLTNSSIHLADTATPTFVPDVAGEYVLGLVVNDGEVDSTMSLVSVTAYAGNVAPNAEAGANQYALLGSHVTANGSASKDPDNNPSALTYQWALLQVPVGSVLDNSNIAGRNLVQAQITPDVVGTYVLELTVSDGELFDSDTIEITVDALYQPPVANAGADQTIRLNAYVDLDGTASLPSSEGPTALSYQWVFVSLPNNSALTAVDILDSNTSLARITPDVKGEYVIALSVTDGIETDIDHVVIEVSDNTAPDLGPITLSEQVIAVNTATTASTTFVDPDVGDRHILTIDWGDGQIEKFAGVTNPIDQTHVYTQAGVYTISMTIEDLEGETDTSVFEYAVAYDPSAGFVTGGGHFTSLEGAYVLDPTASGKASFGFNAKYKQGKNVPDGNTQFNFRAGDINFHSKTYEWLVVAGARAQYKGVGTINNAGNFGFMLTAIDGALPGGGGIDKFRMKIWDRDNADALVYDNELGLADDGEPATAINGGSIIIHK